MLTVVVIVFITYCSLEGKSKSGEVNSTLTSLQKAIRHWVTGLLLMQLLIEAIEHNMYHTHSNV